LVTNAKSLTIPGFCCNLSLQGLRQFVLATRRRGWQITIRQGEKYENVQK